MGLGAVKIAGSVQVFFAESVMILQSCMNSAKQPCIFGGNNMVPSASPFFEGAFHLCGMERFVELMGNITTTQGGRM